MEPLRPTSVLRFGTYEVSLQSGEVRKAGLRIRVQQQPMKLLEILLERPGEVVTREELCSRVWPNENFGDFDLALNIAIGKLRSALGDSAENPRFIETLPKRGYRFIADVSVVDGELRPKRPGSASGDLPEAEPADTTLVVAPTRQLWPGLRIIVAVALALSLPILAFWLFHSREPAPTGIQSLAVLPLENLSGDAAQNYFADGMTDELITYLAQISALRVISRTSVMVYKGARKPLPQIARELHVDAVVEGTVLRAGDQVRITAQLIDASTDKHLWSHSYEGELRDTLALQDRVARAIAEEIKISLTPREQAALKSATVVNPQAYESYLKGRYFWSKRTAEGLKTAIEYFKHAIVIDPVYADAYSGLADSYAVAGDWKYGIIPPREAFPLATAAAAKALELDNSLGEAHASLAFALDLYGWDWSAADMEFKQAIKFSPGYATAHQWYSWHLFILGRNADAMSELKTAQSLDPLSLIVNADIADAFCVAHRFDEAVEQSEKVLKMDANFAAGHYELGQALTQKGMYDGAIAEFRKAIELSGHSGAFDSNLGYAYAVSGRKEEALKIVDDLESRHAENHSVDADIALIYVGLDDRDEAISRLNKAFDARFKASILRRPAFDPLRSDPRFQDLLRRMGLPTIKS